MTGAVCLCLPSLGEGFGLPVAEAMACGAPVVVSNRGALPEVAGDAGVVTGVDAASVAEGLRRALAEGPALRERSLARAAQLPWSAMAQGWADSLRRACEGG
jgi:glycosyltransferase involved in cell wall biosynthesis